MKPEDIDEVLSTLWSRLIRILHPYCWFPNCGERTQEACHIMKRRHRATRWLTENGLGGCQFHNQWEEHNPTEAEELMRKHIGDDLYDRLRSLSLTEAHFSFSDKMDILSGLKKELKKHGAPLQTRPVFKKRSKSIYRAKIERFREMHGGLSPFQVRYRRLKKLKESVDN